LVELVIIIFISISISSENHIGNRFETAVVGN